MRRLFFVLVCLLVFTTSSALASSGNYPDVNRQTIWNNMTDGVHTFGQTPAQARKTRLHLHNVRRKVRQNSINHAIHQAKLDSLNH
jgi:hypothetical protein